MKTIEVSFQHYKFIIPQELKRYNSGYFGNDERKDVLFDHFVDKSQLIVNDKINFNRYQVLCANEVFPEPAIANPLADLEVWNLWRSGNRRFPYPGIYRRLNITDQPEKTSSSSSIGVIGEIMAGLFGQAIISPFVLVRPILRWPDFIFYTHDGYYAYLESKAFTSVDNENHKILSRIKKNELLNFLVDSLREMGSDTCVKIWGSFTYIKNVNPVEIDTTFIEVDFEDKVRKKQNLGIMPNPVVQGLAKLAIERASAKILQENLIKNLTKKRKFNEKLQKEIVVEACEEIEKVLREANIDFAIEINTNLISEAIRKLVDIAVYPEVPEGPDRKEAIGGIQINLEGKRWLMRDMTLEERQILEKDWKPNYQNVKCKWHTDSLLSWRYSSVTFEEVAEDY